MSYSNAEQSRSLDMLPSPLACDSDARPSGPLTPTCEATPAGPLPTISIVTPSYNQGGTLERTIRSVLGQQYPRLEYIVIDGGSTDGSTEIIRRYAPQLSYWQSQPDGGQSHAINDGFKRATGEIVSWLCSDDYFTPGALQRVAEEFAKSNADVVAGACSCVYLSGAREYLWIPKYEDLPLLPLTHVVAQSSCFFRRSLLRAQAVRLNLHYTMDLELWAYFQSRGVRWRFIEDLLSVADNSGENKSQRRDGYFEREHRLIYQEYTGGGSLRTRLQWGERCMRARNYRFALIEAIGCLRTAPWSRGALCLLARAAFAGAIRKLSHVLATEWLGC